MKLQAASTSAATESATAAPEAPALPSLPFVASSPTPGPLLRDVAVYRWLFARIAEHPAPPPDDALPAHVVSQYKLPTEFEEVISRVAEQMHKPLGGRRILPAEPWIATQILSADWQQLGGETSDLHCQMECVKWYDSAYLLVAVQSKGSDVQRFPAILKELDKLLPAATQTARHYENDLYPAATCFCAQWDGEAGGNAEIDAAASLLALDVTPKNKRKPVQTFSGRFGVLAAADFLSTSPVALVYRPGRDDDAALFCTDILPDLFLVREKLRLLRSQYTHFRLRAEQATSALRQALRQVPGRTSSLEEHEHYSTHLQSLARGSNEALLAFEYDRNALLLNRYNLIARLREHRELFDAAQRRRFANWLQARINQHLAQLRGDSRYHKIDLAATDRTLAAVGNVVTTRNAVWTRRATITFSILSTVLATAGVAQTIDVLSHWPAEGLYVFIAATLATVVLLVLLIPRLIKRHRSHMPEHADQE